MNTVELTQHLIGSSLDVFSQVVADLTQEQADWAPPGLANPIGATYWHAISGADAIVHKWILKAEPIFQKDGWQARVLTVNPPEPGPGGDGFAYMRAVRVDVPTLHAYAKVVSEALQGWLATLTPEDLARELETPVGKLSVGQILGTFVIWHVTAHCGEIAALKGCQGAKGFPF